MDTQTTPAFVPFPATAQRITTRFLAGWQREDRTLIFRDGLHVLTVIDTPGVATTYAIDAASGRLTDITGRMPNHIHGLAETVQFWCDDLATQMKAVVS